MGKYKERPLYGWSLEERDPEFIRFLMPYLDWFYHHYFQVKTDGWEHVPDEQALFVGSHNGGLAAPDMMMVLYDWYRRFGTERLVYGLAHPKVWRVCDIIGQMAARTGAIAAHPRMALAALDRGASVLVYPGGGYDVFRPHRYRHQIQLAGNRGFVKLALQTTIPIIPIVSTGAHDTLFVLENIYDLASQVHEWGIPWLFNIDPEVFPLYLGLPWGLGIGPLPNWPLPVPLQIRIGSPIVFDDYSPQSVRDPDYIEACYQHCHLQMQTELDRLVRQGIPLSN